MRKKRKKKRETAEMIEKSHLLIPKNKKKKSCTGNP
jgi:hypothetical protein